MTYILFDIAIAAILLLFLWQGYKKGFVLTLCGFLAVFVAFIGATLISNALAKPVAQAIVPMIESGIHDTLAQSIQETAPDASAPVLPEELPLSDILEALQDSPIFHSLAEAFQQAVDEGVETVATSAAQALAEYIAIQIARTVLFILAFAAVLVAWFFLSHALDLAFKLPVLSTLNHWAGAGVGLIKGGLILFIAAWLLKGSFIPSQAIEQTFLLNFFCTSSPFSLLAML